MIKRVNKTLILAAAAIWAAVFVLPDNKLHVVFCNVGQGDAILITLKTTQILVDGGPGTEVSGCLSRHMPFYDQRIEMMVLTHPEADHMSGLSYVLKRYSVSTFVSVSVSGEGVGYDELKKKLQESGISQQDVEAGDRVRMSDLYFDIVWPSKEYLAENLNVLGAATNGAGLNTFSLTGILKYGDFEVMLTGDGDSRIQGQELANGNIREVEVLKVPHHAGKEAVRADWLDRVSPELAVVSVGKNSYGYPREEVIRLFSDRGIKILRTDLEGDIEIVSDGMKWGIKN